MEIIVSVSALLVSLIALVSNFMSNRYESNSFKDQVYQRFAQMWFDMDQIFINHPHMRKYFYHNNQDEYEVISPENEDYPLGLCIAEMFCDVFQYSEPLEQYLKKEDRESYEDYKKMITNAPVVKMLIAQNDYHCIPSEKDE